MLRRNGCMGGNEIILIRVRVSRRAGREEKGNLYVQGVEELLGWFGVQM